MKRNGSTAISPLCPKRQASRLAKQKRKRTIVSPVTASPSLATSPAAAARFESNSPSAPPPPPPPAVTAVAATFQQFNYQSAPRTDSNNYNVVTCASGSHCHMKNIPITSRCTHRCDTCKKIMHGILCSAHYIENGKMWCKMCPYTGPLTTGNPAPTQKRKRRAFNNSNQAKHTNTLFEHEFTGILDKQKAHINKKIS